MTAGKLDLAETRDRLPAVFRERGITLHAVSGATGEGTRELMNAIGDAVRAARDAARGEVPSELGRTGEN